MFYGHSNLGKVKKSMARLLTVVNERKRIRDQYRQHLENEYIAAKKAEEKALIDEQKALERAERGENDDEDAAEKEH